MRNKIMVGIVKGDDGPVVKEYPEVILGRDISANMMVKTQTPTTQRGMDKKKIAFILEGLDLLLKRDCRFQGPCKSCPMLLKYPGTIWRRGEPRGDRRLCFDIRNAIHTFLNSPPDKEE